MPIYLDPNASVPFTLPSDSQLPEHCRVEFRVRVLTMAQRTRVIELVDRAADLKWVEHPPLVAEALRILLTGWGDMKLPDGSDITDAGQLVEVLTVQESWDLLYGALEAVSLAETDRKKSAALSEAATSAG